MTDEKKPGPIDTIRDGSLKATIWKRESEGKTFYNTQFTKSYKDQEGNYRDTNNFNDQDLLRVGELARSAHHRTTELRRDTFKEKRNGADRDNRGQSRDNSR